MRAVSAGRCGLVLGALSLLAVRTMAAPTGEEIMKKAAAAMKSARTYQAIWQMSMSMGTMGSMAMNMDIKMIPGKKMRMSMATAGQPTGQLAMMGSMMNMQMIDDGKTMFMYNPVMKQYSKGPSQSKTSQMDLSQMTGIAQGATYKVVGTENVGGRPAHKIEVILKNMPMGGGGKQSMLIYIDRATNRFRQMKMSMPIPAQPNQPPQQMTMMMVVKNEQINVPIPDSVFRFTPPPGAKESKGGMMGGGMPFGGMMGGPPGGGRPRR